MLSIFSEEYLSLSSDLFPQRLRVEDLGFCPPAHYPELDLFGASHLGFEDDGAVLLGNNFLSVVPDFLFDVAGRIRAKPDPES